MYSYIGKVLILVEGGKGGYQITHHVEFLN